jgi:hypothetical protein
MRTTSIAAPGRAETQGALVPPNRSDLDKWRRLAGAGGLVGMWALPDAIDAFLGVPKPKGDPAALRELAGVYRAIALDADRLQLEVQDVARRKLPDVWVGQAQEKATEVFGAVGHELDHSVTVCAKAHSELDNLSRSIEEAQRMHADARDPLHRARNELGGRFNFRAYERAREIAMSGMDLILGAIDRAEGCQQRAAKQFTDLATQARAAQLDSRHLSSADRLVLSQSAVPGGPNEVNLILSQNEAERAASRLDRLSARDRERFDALLDGARSPQEKAYLMKALAAGHPIERIEEFDRLIHPHGDDPQWLRDHLTPIYNRTDETTGEKVPVTYGDKGSEWEQTGPTCVASSTVTARAMVDPLYALQLTTGGHPEDPNATSQEAFRRRLLAEQERVYGRPHDQPPGGMSNEESLEASNEELTPVTGDGYEYRDLDGADDRRAVLADVARAVDEGKPVPVIVEGPDAAHQMMIIAHEGDMLQIYNPWGETVWVSEDDFVNGHMDKASDQRLPNVRSVQIPR